MSGRVPELTPDELRRYGRHLVIPEVGPEGQKRLKGSSVLLVGAGGLGSPLALYLAAAGVGRIGLVEFDRVEESNLQRQILFGHPDVGRPKLEVAEERLAAVNPYVTVVRHPERLAAGNAREILEPYDVVADGSDNFPTRYLVNDACVLLDKPEVYGSVFRFEGQLSVFWASRGPCYRCLFPEPPPPGLVPSCADAGVLGVLPGIMGTLQANEVLKLLLGVGSPLIGRYLVFDALGLRFRELALRKDPECPVCAENPRLTELVDYDDRCEVPAGPPDAMSTESAAPPPAAGGSAPRKPEEEGDGPAAPVEIDPATYLQWREEGRDPLLLDVRQPWEHDVARLPDSRLLPLAELPRRLDELPRDRPIVVHCHHGPRSLQATAFLRGKGFPRVSNLRGGIDRWSLEVDPNVPRY